MDKYDQEYHNILNEYLSVEDKLKSPNISEAVKNNLLMRKVELVTIIQIKYRVPVSSISWSDLPILHHRQIKTNMIVLISFS